MSEKRLPREVNVSFVKDHRTGGYHNVLEICSKDDGVRYVMAQDAETAKERDKYKLRAHLNLQAHLQELRVFDSQTGKYIDNGDDLMELAGLDSRLRFEAIAIQNDGTVIICDKCGNFGYIDSSRYSLN